MGRINSQDRCISSESDESEGKHMDGQGQSPFFINQSDFSTTPSQREMAQSTTHIPFAYSDPYFNGLFTAYGPQVIIQPQMGGIAPARVPLPLDLAEDGPIYVNAKQYHGILRRRQIRAKLEAQNKLVKARRPYLHESRHIHALNRVRGSGGRFLSTKQLQQSDPKPPTSSHSTSDSDQYQHNRSKLGIQGHQLEAEKHEPLTTTTTFSGLSRDTDADATFQPSDHRLPSISSHMAVSMQGRNHLMYNGTQHYAPIVR